MPTAKGSILVSKDVDCESAVKALRCKDSGVVFDFPINYIGNRGSCIFRNEEEGILLVLEAFGVKRLFSWLSPYIQSPFVGKKLTFYKGGVRVCIMPITNPQSQFSLLAPGWLLRRGRIREVIKSCFWN